jgi:hypothetical protein
MAVKSVALRGERRRDKAFYRSVQFELGHSELVSIFAGHLQKLIRALALGLDSETL